MRKYHKKLILEMMDSLLQANKEMKKYFSQSDTNNLTNLLADSQDVIEYTNNFFSGYENIPNEVLNNLSSYYQLLFKMNSSPSSNILNEMRISLYKLTNSIKNKVVANKIEVAFLPYSASMFDSLESVWLAAKQDPDCDAYLVPIPYYSRNKQGNLDKMHYDGDYYKQKFDVTYWGDYDIKSRHPDIIYIHNPYDDCNYVTSVHPNYYSKKLKEHTDLLAYIPYFITRNYLDVNFTIPPATINADKVFVQSERDRKIYIENHLNHLKIDAKVSKDRFVAIGSPKVDKVLNSKNEDFSLPSQWDNLIKNHDGTNKKIILYITSLAPLLSGGTDYIKKLQSVFDYFSKRDDVVLWWRPHPLTNETYLSMIPQLQESYNKIMKFYIDASIGIYDDTHDLHRAIAYSDAYYGDYSSVVGVYSFTEKLMMYQDFKINDYNRDFDFERVLNWIFDNQDKNSEWYISCESKDYQTMPSFLNYICDLKNSQYIKKFVELKKNMLESIIASHNGQTGNKIYDYSKNEVMK